MKKKPNIALLKLLFAMFTFGTIGIFRRSIPIPSGALSFLRGLVGTAFLLCVVKLRKRSFRFSDVKGKMVLLCVSGALIGFNWIALFEAYRFTTVATATLCYYMAPIIVTAASALIFKEKLSPKKLVCIAATLLGMVLVSGVFGTSEKGVSEGKGIVLGLTAAVLYACVVLINKKLTDVDAYDKTIVQLGSAAVVMFPYTLIFEKTDLSAVTPTVVILLVTVCIVHTGLAYTAYFSSISDLDIQTVAIFSYVDPVTAIILSAVILHEMPDVFGVIGSVLILGAAIASEIPSKKERTQG